MQANVPFGEPKNVLRCIIEAKIHKSTLLGARTHVVCAYFPSALPFKMSVYTTGDQHGLDLVLRAPNILIASSNSLILQQLAGLSV